MTTHLEAVATGAAMRLTMVNRNLPSCEPDPLEE
jgi:hypothetical protein